MERIVLVEHNRLFGEGLALLLEWRTLDELPFRAPLRVADPGVQRPPPVREAARGGPLRPRARGYPR
jgi:hypothetical protein